MQPIMAACLLIGAMALAGCGTGGGVHRGVRVAARPPAAPPTSGASQGSGSVMGASFDGATSRQLFAKLTLPSTQTWQAFAHPEADNPTSSIRSYSADFQRGIACVKVEEADQPTIWYAKDTTGRVIALQSEDQDEEGGPHLPARIEESYFFPTQDVVAGAVWSTGEEEDRIEWSVVSTDATAPYNRTTGCIQLRLIFNTHTPEQADDYSCLMWWSNREGRVESVIEVFLGSNHGYEYLVAPAG